MTRLNPLDVNVPIVDAQGRPTPEFMLKWQQQQQLNGTIPDLSSASAVSSILDKIGSTAGDLLRRGASAWGVIAGVAGTTKFLRADGTWAEPQQSVDEDDINLSDVLTNNASTTRHGFLPKLDGSSSKYLDGSGQWSTPAGGGGGGGLWWFDPPTASDFTTFTGDANSPSLSDDTDAGLLVDFNTFATGNRFHGAYKALGDGTKDWTVVMRAEWFQSDQSEHAFGLIIEDSTSGRGHMWGLRHGNVLVRYGFSSYSWSSTANSITAETIPPWFKIEHSGGSYLLSVSVDGKQWLQLDSFAETTHMTNPADRVGFGVFENNTGNKKILAAIQHFDVSGDGA